MVIKRSGSSKFRLVLVLFVILFITFGLYFVVDYSLNGNVIKILSISTPPQITPSSNLSLLNPVSFSWSSVSGASYYKIEILNGNGSRYSITKLTNTSMKKSLPIGSYSWRVKSFNRWTSSSWSNNIAFKVVSVSNPPLPPLPPMPTNITNSTNSTTFPTNVSNISFSTNLGRSIPDTLYGVTIEEVSNLNSTLIALDRHTKTPITRIVFQSGTVASDYDDAINRIRNVSYVIGEILDSSSMKGISLTNYQLRTRNFVSRFGNKIDIYEVGNELNGEWLTNNKSLKGSDIIAKAQVAYDVVEKENANLNLKSAITLNYWPSSDCYSYDWENTENFARALANQTDIENGVDYVFLSFYETACDPRAYPTPSQITQIFNTLKTIFPNSKIGFGEIGAQGKADGLANDPTLDEKQRIANTYYGMHNQLKTNIGNKYVGGYFWWYYYQDAVPYNKTNSMWPTIENNFNSY